MGEIFLDLHKRKFYLKENLQNIFLFLFSSPEPLVETRKGAADTEDCDHSEGNIREEDAEQDQT